MDIDTLHQHLPPYKKIKGAFTVQRERPRLKCKGQRQMVDEFLSNLCRVQSHTCYSHTLTPKHTQRNVTLIPLRLEQPNNTSDSKEEVTGEL